MTETIERGDGTGAVPGRVWRVGRYVFAHDVAGSGADCGEQLRDAMENLDATLRAAGSGLDRVQCITYYVRSAAQLPADLGHPWFGDRRPSSTVVEVGASCGDTFIELEATARLADAP